MLNKAKISEIIRVNHAGEFGARVIYDGQIAALKLKKDYETVKLVEEMKAQEDAHFDYFNQEIIAKRVRPTIMQPLWKIGGFGLGFFTAILDKKAAMCCTVAVEEVIDEHYQSQIDFIKKEQESSPQNSNDEILELQKKITQFQAEELEHRDTGYEHKAQDLAYFKPLSFAIKMATKMAISISKKI